MMARMRGLLLLLGLVGCWGSSSAPKSKPAEPVQPRPAPEKLPEVAGGGAYGGDAYGGEDYGGGGYSAGAPPAGGPAAGNPVGPAPVVTVQPPTVGTEAIPREVIHRLVKREFAKIVRCYEQERAANPSLAGTVTVRFTVGGDGKVVRSDGTGLPPVDACVAAVIGAIVFPAPRGGSPVTVNYPFVFRATEP